MAKINIGCDLSGVSVASVVPAGTKFSTTRIVCTGNTGCRIEEVAPRTVRAVTPSGTVTLRTSGGTNRTDTIPEDFGIVKTIDEGSVSYEYLTRGASVNAYAQTTDEELVPASAFIHKEWAHSTLLGIGASAVKTGTVSMAAPDVAGYTPVGIVGRAASSSASSIFNPSPALRVTEQARLTSSGNVGVTYRIENTTSDDLSVALWYEILYVHN